MTVAARLPAAQGRQWLRLRELRVQRARRALAESLAAEREAQQAVESRQARIDAGRRRLGDLARHWGGSGCIDLPRWGQQLAAHRAALEERLERDEYALLDEQETLQARHATVLQHRAELSRAQARESAVDATLQTERQAVARAQEHQAELDAEDARRAPH